MLSTKLVQLIETHWEEIAERLIVAVRKHPEMQNLAARPDSELREWCREILENLGYLLAANKEHEESERRFEVLGKNAVRREHPAARGRAAAAYAEDKIIGFVHEQGFPMTALQLYAEEELELRIGRFFDACVYHVVRGYEAALRLEQRVAS